MIHDWDTHFWAAYIPDEGWISAADTTTADPKFKQATRVRITPISAPNKMEMGAAIPPGYCMFLRTDRIIQIPLSPGELQDDYPRVIYVMALEKGEWSEPWKVPLSEVMLNDGFRTQLKVYEDEEVLEFEGSTNFKFNVYGDKYIFELKEE